MVLLAALPLAAQFSGGIEGVVQDQSGGALPGATVGLKNLATGVAATTKSSDSGSYRFSSLAPGEYEVTASNAGFNNAQVHINVQTAQTANLNLTLQVTGANTSISVSAETPPIDTADSRLQTTMSTQQLQDLPVQGRNFLGLVAVAPGITGHGAVGGGAPGDAQDNFSTEKTVDASGNGRNQSGNEFSLDGLNITSNILQGTASLTPNPDSVQEMAIQTNVFNVEHGRGSSVQVAITTKSGTNGYHGTGAYFYSDQHLRARTEFTKKYEPFKKHDLSATFGGPIIKNHTFFFASVE
ncbi:MAG TPA: carboxypeptidase-like regulatory domain-containing protein, partial [Tepidisphaeraceae bacterium]